MFRFLKTTVLGGALFLVPIVIFIAVIGKAIQLTDKVAAPIARLLPVESIAGLAVVELIALAILVVFCFLAGLAARTVRARKLLVSLEANVLDRIPAYALMKAKTGSMLSPDDTRDMQPVLIQFDDSWQMQSTLMGLTSSTLGLFSGSPAVLVLGADKDAAQSSVVAMTRIGLPLCLSLVG